MLNRFVFNILSDRFENTGDEFVCYMVNFPCFYLS